MKHDLRNKILSVMSRCVDMTVATVRPDGAPQATIVSFAHDGLTLYFGCGAASQKAANIAFDPRVSVTMAAPYRDWMAIEGLSMAAIATEVSVPAELEVVGRLMRERFPQITQITGLEQASADDVKIFRLRPEIISVLDYSKGFGHSDLVKIGADDIGETLTSMRHHWLVAAPAAT